jgi:hypothetical protein
MKTNIEEIILSKSYEELNDDEKKIIHSEISSQQEYNNIRFLLLTLAQSKQEEKIIAPTISMKERLLKEFDKKHESHQETKVRAVNYFTWQKLSIAAAVVFGLILSFYVYRNYLRETPQVAGHNNKIKKKNAVTNKNSTEKINITQNIPENKNQISNFINPVNIDTTHKNYIAVNTNKPDSNNLIETSRTLKDDEMLSELLFTAL